MDAREKLNEFAELRGWDKNKLIGWSEAADFGEWLVKNCTIPHVRQLLIDFCEIYAEGQFEDPDDIEGIVDWYLKVKDN